MSSIGFITAIIGFLVKIWNLIAKLISPARQKKKGSRSYCEDLVRKSRHLDFTGLNAQLDESLPLERIYTKLMRKASTVNAEGKGVNFITVFEKLINDKNKNEPLRVVILGRPGSGKTTLIKWIALQCACSKTNGKTIFSGLTPILVFLKDLGQHPEKTFRQLGIRELIVQQLKQSSNDPLFFEDMFENNKVIFLLDGLDEVTEPEVRESLVRWIDAQNIRGNILLLTSRPSGMASDAHRFPNTVPVFTICDFEIEDMRAFLNDWYRNVELALVRDQSGIEKEAAIKRGELASNDLIMFLESEKGKNLRRIAVNPLLLTLFALVHRRRKSYMRYERHMLFDTVLETMIEYWQSVPQKPRVNFSKANSIPVLAELAMAILSHNTMEIDSRSIHQLLPADIEGHPLQEFLDDMVFKAGLLYYSRGVYGFMHVTFRDYLVAWRFANSDQPLDILDYKGSEEWLEVFKMFAGMTDAVALFDRVINNLKDKSFWSQMQLWDDTLREVSPAEIRKEIELKFTSKILDILEKIKYKETNDERVVQFYGHYGIFKHAADLVDQGRRLFDNARHPFLKSLGSSILFHAGEPHRSWLLEELKKRIEDFNRQQNHSPDEMLSFLFQHTNSNVLLIAGRKSLEDFLFVLNQLKTGDTFVVYLTFIDLRCFLDLPELEDLKNLIYPVDLLGIVNYYYDLADLMPLQDLFGPFYLRDMLKGNDWFDRVQVRYLGNLKGFHDIRDMYLSKYEAIFKKRSARLSAWVNGILKKLTRLEDENLLKYFPNTTLEEIKQFRESV